MRQYINGIPTVQAGPFSREFATVDLWVDPAASKVTKSEIRPHTMICTHVYEGTQQCDPRFAPARAALVPRVYEGTTITNDVKVAAAIDPFLRRVAAKREENVGIRAAERIARSLNGESSLGNIVADALREYASADFGMMNSGGIRADLPAKDLIYADVFAISPFDNFPAVVKMNGKQIAETLRATSTGVRGIMQVSGLRYTIDNTKDIDKPPAERNRVVSLTTTDGTPLDPDKIYTVAMPDFIAAGGDGTWDVMSKVPRENINISYARTIRDILVEVWHKRPQPLEAKVEGRITVVSPPPPAAP
jgi:2',3'-cyclic-nucleotide 2'-phosphodiesterase (5'-nucleotidase family)